MSCHAYSRGCRQHSFRNSADAAHLGTDFAEVCLLLAPAGRLRALAPWRLGDSVSYE
jgi:hypothetical protein